MTSRCRFITSSYFRTFLRESKFCDSTWACADAIAPVTRLFSIGTSSGTFKRGQHPVDPVGLEQPHQLVLEGQVEPRLARVALAAGTTAQLVVDAPRLVALGADHVEAAGVLDLVVLGGDLLLDLLDHRRPGGLVGLAVLERVEALLAQLLVGEELHRAAEHDVGAATGHVGGHGDRALVPGQRDDLRLVVVLLGVQHGVRDALAASAARTAARTSPPTRCRPAPAGPSRAARAMSSTTASYFASSVR